MAPMNTRPITPPQSVANCWTVWAKVAGGGEAVTRPLSAGPGGSCSHRQDGWTPHLPVRLSVVPPPPAGPVRQGALDLPDVDVEALGQRRGERVALVRADLV